MYVCVAKSLLVISGSVFENQAIASHVCQEHNQHHSSSSLSALSAIELALFLVTIPCAICASRYSSNDPYDEQALPHL
jgi:hypothetical protein